MNNDGDIIILTPVYDDWESAFILLGQLDEVLAKNDLKASVVIVDDGTPIISNLEDFEGLSFSAIQNVEVLTLARNMGNQRAQAIGIGYVAANRECATLVLMDSDLEDPPEYVPELIAAANETGNEIVFAARTRRSEGATFKILYKAYKYLYKVLTGMPISIGNFSAIPGRLVRRVASVSEIWSHFPAGIMRARVPFRAIPTVRGRRLKGESKMNLVSLVVHGLSGFAVHADIVGVRIIIAIFVVGGAILAALVVVIAKRFLVDFFLLGWTSLVVIILGVAVIQTFFAAIFMAFLILSGRNHRTIIPAIDYSDFILERQQVYPLNGEARHAHTAGHR